VVDDGLTLKQLPVMVEAENEGLASRFVEDNYFQLVPSAVRNINLDTRGNLDHTLIKVLKVTKVSSLSTGDVPIITAKDLKAKTGYRSDYVYKEVMKLVTSYNSKRKRSARPTPAQVVLVNDDHSVESKIIPIWELAAELENTEDFRAYGADSLRQPLYLFEPAKV
jgi:hypothetical protein